MTERKGTKGLELWCRRMTEGYPGVNITNMTTSWRDGLAFCAIIHHFRPDLIEFSKLNKDDIYYNNELAFRTAERHLGIPALLEPEDMVEFPVPDRLSILTYLSQFYQAFVVSQGKSPARTAQKRPTTDSPDHHGRVSPTTTTTGPPSKVPMAIGGVVKIRREPCAKCNLPVFIAERLNVGKRLYHRTCFRCDRCNSQLTLANYYETENNQYCCEICPDEEQQSKLTTSSSSTTTTTITEQKQSGNIEENEIILTRSLSDEEKSVNMKKTEIFNEFDDYSTKFETALEFPDDNTLKRDSTLTTNARFFINSQIDDGDDETIDKTRSDDDDNGIDDVKPPDLPATSPPSKSDLIYNVNSSDSFLFSNNINNNNNNNNDSNIKIDKFVNSDNDNIVTKDTVEGDLNVSLVKSRMLLFENQNETVKKSENNIIVPSLKHKNLNNEIEQEEQFDNTDNDNKIDNTIITISDDDSIKENSDNIDDTIDNSIIVIDNSQTTILTVSDCSEHENLSSDTINKIKDNIELENNTNQDYPDDLNPFDDDNGGDKDEPIKATKTTKISLNPFDDDDENGDDITEIIQPKPRTRRKILPSDNDRNVSVRIERISVNPFEDDDDNGGGEDNENGNEATIKTPQPAVRRKIVTPNIALNPFLSDDDDDDDGSSINNVGKPIPKPRMSKTSSDGGSELSSLSSSQSTIDRKKKKPAPKPPPNSGSNSLTSTPTHSICNSPHSTPKIRKNRKAPPPPQSSSSTPLDKPQQQFNEFEKDKQVKDEMNRTKQNENTATITDKSTYGKWKRRKGQAPPRPIPQRRTIKSLPIAEIKHELELIEIQQQGLEKQGVRLEHIIRDKCENVDSTRDDEPLSPEVDDLILQLFELVNEKNELFRKQNELMYLRRQYRLEVEHADVEYQIRCLMLQPETTKTDSDKAKEEELIKRLVEIVERRNEIIECLEMDRVREAEEDDCINSQLNLYTLKIDDKLSNNSNGGSSSKKKLKKKFKLKSPKVDADKDIDESETTSPTSSKVKEKKKKKFSIF